MVCRPGTQYIFRRLMISLFFSKFHKLINSVPLFQDKNDQDDKQDNAQVVCAQHA